MDESQPQDDFNPADQNSRASGNRLKSYCSSAGMSQKDLRDEIKMVQRDARFVVYSGFALYADSAWVFFF